MMKAFWTFIMVLVLAAGGLMLKEFRAGNGGATGAVQEAAGVVGSGSEDGAIEPDPITETPAAHEDPVDDSIVVDVGVVDEPGEDAEDLGEPALLGEDASVENAPNESDIDIDIDIDTETETEAEDESAYTLMLNDRYGITGSGTADDPYALEFDMLVSLEQDYEPKTEGKTRVPDWIKPLDGKHVIITGFIGFPFIAPSADECMVMLNQWDGCCIGVPPTPYDAVEVQLAEPIDLQSGVINYGTLTGVFRTDPYLVNGWLIGLYVMDEARLERGGSKNQSGF